jgi:predicted RNA polymerase sigma factor
VTAARGVRTNEHLLRELAPQVLGAVVRRYGDFSAAEDAVQEALFVASTKWPEQGVPDNPRAWLIQVAARRLTDQLRSELSRLRRETAIVMHSSPDEHRRSRSRCARWAGSRRPKSHTRSSCPRPRWRSVSAVRSS